MATSWIEQPVSDGFDLYDDVLEQLLGYPFVYNMISFEQPGFTVCLDYGCGPGKVAYRFAQHSKKKIIAVDESGPMIAIAKKTRNHPLVNYTLINKDDISFIEDDSLSSAILCFVLLNLGEKQRIEKILTNIHRKLQPGASCVILDTHPASTGLKFLTFQSGQPNQTYCDGDPRPASLFLPDHTSLQLEGYYWSEKAYVNMLLKCGYGNINILAPTLSDLLDDQLEPLRKKQVNVQKLISWTQPPYIVITGYKPLTNEYHIESESTIGY